MKDVYEIIQYRDKEYRLIFNLNVMEQIQEEYGSMDEWGKATDLSSGEPNAKAVKFGIMCMLNEGIDIVNEENGTNDSPLTAKQVGRMLTEVGLALATKKLNDAVIKSTESTEKNR